VIMRRGGQPCLFNGRFSRCLDDFVEDIAVLVDGSPEPVLLARDRDYDLAGMPDVAATRRLRLRR
jgi:hypothetical protein